MSSAALLAKYNVRVAGHGTVPLVFGHGYGCDQGMWRLIAPKLQDRFKTVLFDFVGSGGSEAVFDPQRYETLEGYADDVLEICRAVSPGPVVFIGHSVSSMIGVLAAAREPERFSRLVLVAPSPRYIDDAEYVGGFAQEDIESLLKLLEADHTGWAAAMAPAIMGNLDRPELAGELEASFCRVDPAVARHFARVTFTSDNRSDLARVQARSLVLQCSDDAIAPPAVGAYVHRHLLDSELVTLKATGHCPHLSAPEETTRAIDLFLSDLIPSSVAA
ncbi:MAG TPA: alpha/beta hydrolase [Roseomonas sp.]|jgi:sigma-B regulation protein RsbQ